MKFFPKIFGPAVLSVFGLILPTFVFAAGVTQTFEQLYNPLPADELFCPTVVCDLTQMLLLITRDILQLIPIASVLFIVIGGFKMVMSQGNVEKVANAKKTIYWAVAGLAISIMSFSIVAMLKNLLGVSI